MTSADFERGVAEVAHERDPDDRRHLLIRVEGGVGIVTLNRPARRNALSPEMVQGLAEILQEWERDDEIGAVVLTGAGQGFCAGGDVKAFAERGGEGGGSPLGPEERAARQVASQRATVERLHAMVKPTIAALPGPAAGAGLGLALACDFRLGSDRADLVTAFARVGLSGDYGVAWLLSRLAGGARARRALLLGERIRAVDAVAAGLLDRVVEDPLAEAIALAGALAQGPRFALARIKENLLDAERLGLAEAMEREVSRHQACGGTAEHREALAAFVEKRAPRFARTREERNVRRTP
ncbi:enoyl-CoA hydratase-related protein [Actinomadura sp. SCN-SB]|uniref:enoyl-CoA hydratase-related protein n=1 Tax=Actinomadura sp. SCN-SB TaxID=3373092 RepID=UPI0037531051